MVMLLFSKALAVANNYVWFSKNSTLSHYTLDLKRNKSTVASNIIAFEDPPFNIKIIFIYVFNFDKDNHFELMVFSRTPSTPPH